MKHRLFVLIGILILICLPIFSGLVHAAQINEASYCVDADFPPFSYYVNNTPQGFETDLVNKIFETGEYRLVMKSGYSWDEIYEKTKSGELDISGTIVKTPKRAEEVLFTEDAYTRYYGIFNKNTVVKLDLSDLSQYRLGAVKGYYSEIIVRDEIKASQYKVFDTYEEMINALSAEQIDAFIETTEVVKYYIEKNHLVGQIILQQDGLYPVSVPFGVSKARPDLVKFINARLKEIKSSGEYELLYIKNFSTNSKDYYDQEKRKLLLTIIGLIAGAIILQIGIQFYIRYLHRKIISAQGFSKAIVDNASVAIILWNHEGLILDFNRFASEMTGYKVQEVVGNQWRDLFFSSSDSPGIQMLLGLINDHNIERSEHVEIRCRDGSLKSLLISSAAVGEMKSGNEVIATFASDVTDILESRKRLSESVRILEENSAELEEMNAALEAEVHQRIIVESELTVARDAAEAASVAKDRFLANMSHEIRTPMNGFMGMIQLMQMTEMTEEQQRYMDTAKRSTDGLLKVVNDILDYSKIEAGKMQLVMKPFSMATLLEDVKSLFTPACVLKDLDLISDYEDASTLQVIGDEFRLKQILSNLVGNAVKFTSKGEIRIRVRTISSDSDTRFMEFSVEDTGIGIDEEHLDKVFDRFSQGDETSTRVFGGTGLGLSICKSLVSLMSGEISVESVIGRGSRFRFTCKLLDCTNVSPGDREEPAVINPPFRTPHPVKKRVLLGEDDEVSQMVIQGLFTKLGWEVILANNGEEVVEYCTRWKVDLILMDIQMPVMDGFQATKKIRDYETQQGKHTPIIALTAHAMPEYETQAIAFGMDGFLSKPISMKQLSDMIGDYFDDL